MLTAGSVPVGASKLYFRPWASANMLLFKVEMELHGIRVHAWSEAASRLIDTCYWVEHLGSATAKKSDRSWFRLTTWTNNPARIPSRPRLIIQESELPIEQATPRMEAIFHNVIPYLSQKCTLSTSVVFQVCWIADFTPHSWSSSCGTSHPFLGGDSGLDVNPYRRYGGGSSGSFGPRFLPILHQLVAQRWMASQAPPLNTSWQWRV